MIPKIQIAIVDDDPVWLNGMITFLNEMEDFAVVASATNRLEALEIAENAVIDILLMDVNLGTSDDGIHIVSEIAEKKPIKTIMLTSLYSEEVVINSFTAGAINYIQKENYLELPTVIRSVYYEKSSPIEILVRDYGRLKEEELLKPLSTAEKQLLRYIEDGYSQSQIARILYKSIGTIKSQVNAILKKLDVTTSKEAIKKIRSKGIFKTEK